MISDSNLTTQIGKVLELLIRFVAAVHNIS